MSKELLVIEAADVYVVVKGEIAAKGVATNNANIPMQFYVSDPSVKVYLYDVSMNSLVLYEGQPLAPVFYENGTYELKIQPREKNVRLGFEHEYKGFQQRITEDSRTREWSGILNFVNEIGFSEFIILKDEQLYFSFTIEIFPVKLDYQKDYVALLKEVNDEIYNLAYSFLEKTYLNAAKKKFKDPMLTEFFRLIERHFDEYITAIEQVERRAHHYLQKSYEQVRGDRLRKQDNVGRSYLRKKASQFVDVQNGLSIAQRTVMPTKGLQIKKVQTYDTHENRYVKWSMERILSRLTDLRLKVERHFAKSKQEGEIAVLKLLHTMEDQLKKHLFKPFWREIGKLDRSVYSLVMQMGMGYREVYYIYTTLSQSLVLQNSIYKMSVKNIAAIYEYWSFLKLGKILEEKGCKPLTQQVVTVDRDGLSLSLKMNEKAERTFKHPKTGEEIIIQYQYSAGDKTFTVEQRPDTMLTIKKGGRKHGFQYIFDAKYRLNQAERVGPVHEDINVMHRYRDAIVAQQMNLYERLTFGAYVLFPWHDDEEYRKHDLFKSIEKVNIGGLPFLPNNTAFVEEMIDNLLNKSAEELQRDGILPHGAVQYFQSFSGDALVTAQRVIEDEVKWIFFDLEDLPEDANRVQFIASIDLSSNICDIYNVTGKEIENEQLKYYLANRESQSLDLKGVRGNELFIVTRQKLHLANSLTELFLSENLLYALEQMQFSRQVTLQKQDVASKSKVIVLTVGKDDFEIKKGWLLKDGDRIHMSEEPQRLKDWLVVRVNK